tara:strand:+ start:2022 stop:2513 length:492 start_codon:yes stop_codon:yes gene_type:complete
MSDIRDATPYDTVFRPDHKSMTLAVDIKEMYKFYEEEGELESVPAIFKWEDGSLIPQVLLPGVYEVCNVCQGKGTVVDPRMDRNGLGEEQLNDPDFMDGYWSGRFDIPCRECKGRRVVMRVDVSNDPTGSLKVYLDHIHKELNERAEEAAESARIQRMESGGY